MRNSQHAMAFWLLGAACACGGGTVPAGGMDGGNDAAWTPCEGTGPSRWRKIPPIAGADFKHAAVVWTGEEILVWGSANGSEGFRYRLEDGVITPISARGAPSPRSSPYSAWTGRELIIWGGGASTPDGTTLVVADGARYDPQSDRWIPMSTEHDLQPVYRAVTVWTGTEFLVWSGTVAPAGFTNRGARYRPDLDRWIPMSTAGAPSPRMLAAGVWTGKELLVWGGNALEDETPPSDVSTGGRYDPVTDTWQPTSMGGAPSPRQKHTLSWTGQEAIVWGGFTDGAAGARYQPATDSWSPVSDLGAPSPRTAHAAVSTGERVVIFGGRDGTTFDDGGIYDPGTDTWESLPSQCSEPRADHAGVWAGSGAFFWGGFEPPSWSTQTTGALLLVPP